ncbi:MAG: GNAT family N-acetyltransferase [Tistlia sp.]|uniref:GNAT family N-acetyltransferase n=1 Tax=Tistlia sp. TaxID=3057121 RepID=UPI0034A2DC7F
MPRSRQWMTIDATPQALEPSERLRQPEAGDARAVGLLLHDAYAGTVDDEGESPEEAVAEATKALDGTYGTPIPAASFMAMDDGQPVSVSFVTEFEGEPLLAFCATAKAHQRHGLATDLVRRSLDALARLGYRRLRLIVTRANEPAVRLYRELGFLEEKDDA